MASSHPIFSATVRVQSVLLVRVTSVVPIVAPSYRFYPEEVTEASQIASAMRTYGVHPRSDAE